ncbi:hypothetical protein B0H19DRAFT_96520 [Mycena capillaripes]|nr:hypothetical protein B0H19DRAFT_96520 [Mycena capillaripes]
MLSALEADRACVATIDAEILDPEQRSFPISSFALPAERALAQERLDSYKYPVLTLPSEIVSEIFLHFLPTYPLCPPLMGIFSPTVLTHICHKWREIAVATPMLWRAISLSKLRPGIFEAWLNRSGHCPLSFDLINWDALPEVVALATSHCARWEYFKLTLYRGFSFGLPSLDGPMPLLRHLELSVEQELDPIITFGDAPLLRSVLLDADAAASVSLPWAQLTSLTLERVSPRDSSAVLQQTSNLLHCELNLYHGRDNQLSFPDIRLLRLESLVLNQPSISITPVTGYLETLIAPALRSLQVSEEFLHPNPIDSLSIFLSKSGCNPDSVDITGTISIPEDSYRRAFPSIQNFLLNGWSCKPDAQ